MANKPQLSTAEWMRLGQAFAQEIGVAVFIAIGMDVIDPERVGKALTGQRFNIEKSEALTLIRELSKHIAPERALQLSIAELGEEKVREIITYLKDRSSS